MILSTYELQFADLNKSSLHWAEDELRLRDNLGLYFLDFESLPWSAAILAAPRNHVLSSVPRSSYGTGEIAVDVGPQQAAWTQSFFIDRETPRKFKKELKIHGLKEQQIPHGLLPYDGELLGLPIGFNKKERPLTAPWFRTYLIPRTTNARTDIAHVLREYIAERGIFFVRPFDDEKLRSIDWETRYLGFDDHDEAVLFRNSYSGTESGQKERLQIGRLESALAELEKGTVWDFLAMGPSFDDFTFQISYSDSVVNYLKDYSAMNHGQRNSDLVNALRTHLVRLLEWPVFIHSIRVCRERAIERFRKGPKPPPGLLPFDAVEEINLFLKAMELKYPSYWNNSWDAIWSVEK